MKSEPTPIFDNAVDSLEHGVSHYLVREEAPTAIKYAILTIYHSIELFLKEKLARVHPVLIYRSIDKPISDDSPTVGLGETLARLGNLGLGLSQGHVKALHELQRRRNRIEHQRFDPAADHHLAVGQALKFLLEFLPQHLETSLEELLQETDTYRAVLNVILTYEERVKQAISEAATEGRPVITCPKCGEDTLVVDTPRGHYCFFCYEDFILDECARCGQQFAPSKLDFGAVCSTCSEEVYQRL